MSKREQGRVAAARSGAAAGGPARAPRARPGRRSRRRPAGLLATVGVVAVAAVAGLLLARGSSTRNLSVGGAQKVALPASAGSGSTASLEDLGAAPAFSIETLAGSQFSLASAHGPVVLSFIAGWCGSCLEEASADGQVMRSFGKRGVRVLAIDADPNDSLGQLHQFMRAAGNPPIQWAWDRQSKVVVAYKVRALDTTVIIDRGRIVYRDEWPTDYATFKSVLDKIV